jgi:succinylarginine dihydrolase
MGTKELEGAWVFTPKQKVDLQKEIDNSGSPSCCREVVLEKDGTYTVVQEHPTLGVTDVWQDFQTEQVAQAFADGLTIRDENEATIAELELAMFNEETIEREIGDVYDYAWVDPRPSAVDEALS